MAITINKTSALLGLASLMALSFANMPDPSYLHTEPLVSIYWFIPALGIGILVGYLLGRKPWKK